MNSEHIEIKRAGLLLRGRFHRAERSSRGPAVLLLQGSPGNEEDVLGLGSGLAQAGISVLTFNYSGTLRSEGLSSFAATQADIAAAYEFIRTNRKQLDIDPSLVVLGGWSYGGGMGMTYAANHPEVRALFSIAGTDHGEFMREYATDERYREMVDHIFEEMARPDSPWRLAPGATPRDYRKEVHDITPYDLRKAADQLADRQILLVGAWDDTSVKVDNHILPLYRTLQRAGCTSVSIQVLATDHAFTDHRQRLLKVVLDWIENLHLDD